MGESGATWQPLAAGRGPQQGAAAVYDPALGDVVVFATQNGGRSPTSQTWLWNGSRWITGP